MKPERFITLFEKITPDENKKDAMLENILKNRTTNKFKSYTRYFTAAVSVFAVLTILYIYPQISSNLNHYEEKRIVNENSELLYEDILKYSKYIPNDVLNEDYYLGGNSQGEIISFTFSKENLTLDVKLIPKRDFSGTFDDLNNIQSATLTLDGGEYAVTYGILSQEENVKDILNTTEYFK